MFPRPKDSLVVFATDDAETRARLCASLRSYSESDVRVCGFESEKIVPELLAGTITTICLAPSAPEQWFLLQMSLARQTVPVVRPHVVLMAPHVDSPLVYRFLAYGADDVLDVASDDVVFFADVEKVMLGRDRVCRRYFVADVDPVPSLLVNSIDYSDKSDRQIVLLLAAGYTDREIADVVHFSHQVVRNRISRLLQNSGLRNRTQLAARSIVERLTENL